MAALMSSDGRAQHIMTMGTARALECCLLQSCIAGESYSQGRQDQIWTISAIKNVGSSIVDAIVEEEK